MNAVTLLDLLNEQQAVPARAAPVKPILRYASFADSAAGRWRRTLLHSWGPGPKLCWICYCPDKSSAAVTDLAVKRITTWTYRSHYAGFLIACLYPAVVNTRAEARAWRKAQPDAAALMAESAVYAAHQARANQCSDIVLATGPLDLFEREDFATWLEIYRLHRGARKTRWLCLGTTETGWPLPPAGHGRSVPSLEARLVPWRQPVETRKPGSAAAPTARQGISEAAAAG